MNILHAIQVFHHTFVVVKGPSGASSPPPATWREPGTPGDFRPDLESGNHSDEWKMGSLNHLRFMDEGRYTIFNDIDVDEKWIGVS